MNWRIQERIKGEEGITSTINLPTANAFRGPRIGTFSKLHICLYCSTCSGRTVPCLTLRSAVFEGGCTAFHYLFFSVSGALHLSEKDSLRKVKVQKDSKPIGNKPPLCLYTGSLTPHSWVSFIAEGKLIIVNWLGDQPSICTYSCHQPRLCFPCDSFISGAIATGLGCTRDKVPCQTEFKAPLTLQWIRRNSLFKYLPVDPELAKTEGIFHWDLLDLGSCFQNFVCLGGKAFLGVRSWDHSSGLPE